MAEADSPALPPARGRPKDASKRRAIVAAARALFLAEGLRGVSMDAVAAEAGVSKRTVYSHFADKEALFLSVVEAEVPDLHAITQAGEPAAPPALADLADLRGRLEGFGTELMGALTRPGVLDLGRLLLAEARRHPQLAARFYAFGPERSLMRLTALLATADAAGLLATGDPAAAADLFLGMCQGMGHLRRQLGIDAPPPPEEIAAHVRRCAALLIRGCRPGGGVP